MSCPVHLCSVLLCCTVTNKKKNRWKKTTDNLRWCQYLFAWGERLQYLSGIDCSLHYGEVVSVQNGVHVRNLPSEDRENNQTYNIKHACLHSSHRTSANVHRKSVNCKISNSHGFTYTVHVLTLTERHTAFCQTSPSQCELYPCGNHMETIFRNAPLTQTHRVRS